MAFPDFGRPAFPSSTVQATPTVTNCPFCKSTQVTTATKNVSASTYWRCTGCGEIWNPSREVAQAGFRRPRW